MRACVRERRACVRAAYARLYGVVERGRVGLKRVRRESILSSSILTRGSQWLLVSAPRQQRGGKTIQTLAFFTSRSSAFRYGRLTASRRFLKIISEKTFRCARDIFCTAFLRRGSKSVRSRVSTETLRLASNARKRRNRTSLSPKLLLFAHRISYVFIFYSARLRVE